ASEDPFTKSIAVNIGVIKNGVTGVVGSGDRFLRFLFAFRGDFDSFASGDDSPTTVGQSAPFQITTFQLDLVHAVSSRIKERFEKKKIWFSHSKWSSAI